MPIRSHKAISLGNFMKFICYIISQKGNSAPPLTEQTRTCIDLLQGETNLLNIRFSWILIITVKNTYIYTPDTS